MSYNILYVKILLHIEEKIVILPETVEAVELSLEKLFSDAMLARSCSITFITDNQIIIIINNV